MKSARMKINSKSIRGIVLIALIAFSPLFFTSVLAQGVTSILDIGLKFKLGASYRIEESFSGLFMFKISPRINVGYAYETNVDPDFRGLAKSTHELFFSLLM